MLRDSACEGWVVHRRRWPNRHTFRYPLWMLYVDVDRLGAHASPWFSVTRRPAPLSLRPDDFPREPRPARAASVPDGGGIRAAVNARLADAGFMPAERVFLLTQPRSWGWLFNSVSLYFCFNNGALQAVLAEITNTPWDEVHTYVLDARGQDGTFEFHLPKRFHVSPFMPMGIDYRWRIKLRGDDIEVAMSLLRDEAEVFFAGLYLHTDPLTAATLRRGAWRYPLQNIRTLGRIYWQAFKLWCKRTPFHPHPDKIKEARST